MKTDYTYCLNEDTCIHRFGCKRWIGNYTEKEVIELTNTRRDEYLDDEECMREDYEYDNVKHPFDMLDRFRNSDGSELCLKQ